MPCYDTDFDDLSWYFAAISRRLFGDSAKIPHSPQQALESVRASRRQADPPAYPIRQPKAARDGLKRIETR
jgi:hypothetical protein